MDVTLNKVYLHAVYVAARRRFHCHVCIMQSLQTHTRTSSFTFFQVFPCLSFSFTLTFFLCYALLPCFHPFLFPRQVSIGGLLLLLSMYLFATLLLSCCSFSVLGVLFCIFLDLVFSSNPNLLVIWALFISVKVHS